MILEKEHKIKQIYKYQDISYILFRRIKFHSFGPEIYNLKLDTYPGITTTRK